MTNKKTRPYHLFLLPVFFVFHSFIQNYNSIPVQDALLLTGIYLLSACLIVFISFLFFRNINKAGLLTTFILGFHFFFGAFHDTIKKLLPGSIVTRYSFMLPAIFVVLILLIIWLKKTKRSFNKSTIYLNLLLVILLIMDCGWLVLKSMNNSGLSYDPADFRKCETCIRPDIYFILMDEYAGKTSLKDNFRFDNLSFENELKNRGFHIVPDSYSNYNYTPFSVASTLNMEYLNLTDTTRTGEELQYSYKSIRDNKLLGFLKWEGYTFYNHSIFDFEGQPGTIIRSFLPSGTKLITSQTFVSRVDRDIRFNTISRWGLRSEEERFIYGHLKNNQHLYQLTYDLAGRKTSTPKFVYCHLMMPHYPYFFDRNGNPQPFDSLTEGNQHNRNSYVEYLQYANKKILQLTERIMKNSDSPPIIILLGDHGFRHFGQKVDRKYYFLNLSAIYLPGKDYSAFYDGMSNVNVFRAVLNTTFEQQLPYLKDSAIYLR